MIDDVLLYLRIDILHQLPRSKNFYGLSKTNIPLQVRPEHSCLALIRWSAATLSVVLSLKLAPMFAHLRQNLIKHGPVKNDIVPSSEGSAPRGGHASVSRDEGEWHAR